MAKIEYEKLKRAKSDGYEWVARDEDGWVYAHRTKPEKYSCSWINGGIYKILSSHGSAFKVLSWHDEEPRWIDDLLEEYESKEDSAKTIKFNPQDLIGAKVEFDDPVHSPSHYMQGHIETIDKIKLLLTPEEYLGYLKGNVIKYDRAPFKGNMEQDYDKQKVYYDWAIEQVEEMRDEE